MNESSDDIDDFYDSMMQFLKMADEILTNLTEIGVSAHDSSGNVAALGISLLQINPSGLKFI